MSDPQRKRIGIFSYGRIKSQRCPNKMLRPFGNTCLAEILFKKLHVFGSDAFFAGYEPEFMQLAASAGVRFIQRSENSVSIDGPISEVLSFLEPLDYDYFLIINGCLPFLKVSTIQSFLRFIQDVEYRSCSAVSPVQNYFFQQDGAPINFDLRLKTLNTKAVAPILAFANALYFFRKDYFLKNGRYWDWNTVKLFRISDPIELLDVDTETDFQIAHALWNDGTIGEPWNQ